MIASDKKINVVSQFWPPNFVGGGEISTYIICQELVGMGYKVTILTPNVPVQKDKRFKFIKLYNPPEFLISFEKNYFSKIFLKENSPEGIYWASDYYGAAYLSTKSVRKIVTVRDHWPICITSLNLLKDYSACDGCNSQNIAKHYGIDGASLYKKLLRLCSMLYNQKFRKSILLSFDHVIFVSHYIADKITASIPVANYSTIHNPLARDYIKDDSFNISINKNILFSGFVKEFKGIDILLKAIKELVRVDQRYHLTVVGYGDLEKYMNISERMGLEEQVEFAGKLSIEKIIQMYISSTIVVVPSLCFETFSRTVIEGMSQRCIVIATDRGGPTEIIKNGKTGFLFEKGDYNQLARIVINLYQNPEVIKKIQEEARKFAIKNFSPEKIAKQYDLIFQRYF